MSGRYEIRDSHHPHDRGPRFTTIARARRELAHAVPAGRFYLYDRANRGTIGDDDDHAHNFGAWEVSRLAGTLHRKCLEPGCRVVSLDDDDDDD